MNPPAAGTSGPSAPAPASRPAPPFRPPRSLAAALGATGPAGPSKQSPGAVSRALLACSLLAVFLPGAYLGGCAPGGTSTDAGNPELVIGFRQGGKPVDFKGVARIFASDSNPTFYSPTPLDGKRPPEIKVVLNYDRYGTNAYPWTTASPLMRLNRRFLDEAAGYRAVLPVLPEHLQGSFAAQIAVRPGVEGLHFNRPFNLLFRQEDSTTALVEGISIDALRTGYLAADGTPFDVLWVDLERGVDIKGTIDTAGLPDPPLILFLPGTPLSAPVHGNGFRLAGAPRSKFAVRMVTRSGLVYAMRDSLDGTRSDAFYDADSTLTLVPGDRQDSVDLPDILPFPAAPEAEPAGPKTFVDNLQVTLTAEEGAVIFYTTNGNEPDLESEPYSGPVPIKATLTLKAVAYRKGQLLGPVSSHQYIQLPPSPKAAPAGQAFRDSIRVTLTTSAPKGVIRYTLDGTAPHDSSQAYDRPLVLKATTTLKAVTWVAGSWPSQPIEEKYTLLPDSLAQP